MTEDDVTMQPVRGFMIIFTQAPWFPWSGHWQVTVSSLPSFSNQIKYCVL